ncbi:MAG: hypothetical protein ABSB70_25155 [Candidatus Velthaea sp.]
MTLRIGRRLAAGVLFGAVTILFGIVTHLTAELVGLGWRLDMSLVFSGRHAYLGVIAASCVVAAIAARLSRISAGVPVIVIPLFKTVDKVRVRTESR